MILGYAIIMSMDHPNMALPVASIETIRIVVERNAEILYWTCIYSNKNGTDNGNLTIRTRKINSMALNK